MMMMMMTMQCETVIDEYHLMIIVVVYLNVSIATAYLHVCCFCSSCCDLICACSLCSLSICCYGYHHDFDHHHRLRYCYTCCYHRVDEDDQMNEIVNEARMK